MTRTQFLSGLAGISPAMADLSKYEAAKLARGRPGVFVEQPYLQIGRSREVGRETGVDVLWQSNDQVRTWSVKFRPLGEDMWRTARLENQPIRLWSDGKDSLRLEHWADGKNEYGQPVRINTQSSVHLPTVEPHRVWKAQLTGLAPGSRFEYEVDLDGVRVFRAEGRTRPGRGQRARIAFVSDFGDPVAAARTIAYRIHEQQPDVVIMPGDIVYIHGRVSEYRRCHFDNYNNDHASIATGAPVLRSIPTLAGLGEHDTGTNSGSPAPHDILGYYFYWSQPLNGPSLRAGDANVFPVRPVDPRQKALLESAGQNFPRMAHYSCDIGDIHFTFLDTARHVDWNHSGLRQWLDEDLASAAEGMWKIVICYLPLFHSGKDYQRQKMRIIADIVQRHNVSMMIGGMHHSYQRSKPLLYRSWAKTEGIVKDYDLVFPGEFEIDREFDGNGRRPPKGTIHIVTGSGGHEMHNREQTRKQTSWQPFTAVFDNERYSFTFLEGSADRLQMRQIDDSGKEIDSYSIERG